MIEVGFEPRPTRLQTYALYHSLAAREGKYFYWVLKAEWEFSRKERREEVGKW